MKMLRLMALAAAAALLSAAAYAAPPAAKPAVTWDLAALSKPPQTYPAPGFEAKGVKALFYDGLPYKGKPTRVFAWVGLPEKIAPGQKVPGMVLVHGGGGTAFDDWVRMWTARGYAAISMDTCGCTSGGTHSKRPRHDLGGPAGWGGYDKVNEPIEDQWMYHAVADVILANSLLRSMPEVDADRIGLTGISWGGVLTCTVSGLDPRFKFAAPVYGCGFLGDTPNRLLRQPAGDPIRERWLALWDPSNYLAGSRVPMLWVTGTNDFAFPMPSLQMSYRLAAGPRTLAVRVAMKHSQKDGAEPEEIALAADHLFRGGPAPVRVTGQGVEGGKAWVSFDPVRPPTKVELACTTDSGDWQKRPWTTAPADIDAAAGKARAALPEGATVWYFNLIDAAGRVISSEHGTK